MKKELQKLIDDCIILFEKESSQTQIFYPELNDKKYFVKVGGPDRAKYLLNEIESLKKIKNVSPFYKNYYIGHKKKDGKVAIMLKYVSGIDLQNLLKSRKMNTGSIINLYKILLKKIKLFHDIQLNHGDIKPHNLYAYSKSNGDIDIEYIDTESVNDFSKNLKNGEGYNNVITSKYDFPFKIKRSRIIFKDKENAFSFYKYLDIYSISIFIFYLYNKDLYKKLRNDTETPWIIKDVQKTPLDYLDKNKNKLEKTLYYTFTFLKYLSNIDKTHDVKDIPITIPDILKLLDS
jgi:serine/threonine protein kinase